MTATTALPFVLTREQQAIGKSVITTTEDIHGIVHIVGNRLRVQWRIARAISHVGREIRTDVEMEPVTEAEVPLDCIAGAEVRQPWWSRLGLPTGASLVIRATDLRAFEVVAGAAGLALDHPAEFVIPVRRRDALLAREFAAELALAIAEDTASDRSLPSATTPTFRNERSLGRLPSMGEHR